MSSNASRSASAEPSEGRNPREASTSQSKSPPPNGIESKEKDDTHQDDRDLSTSPETTPSETNETDNNNGKSKADSDSAGTSSGGNTMPSQGDWQAIWAPMQNAYYFHNVHTNETTWTNPLQSPQPPTGEAETAGASASYASTSAAATAEAAASAAGIDPSLAYLDPSLGLPGSSPAGTFTAKFNARTGAFARVDARDPSHLSESERAKRMSEVYFDVGAWEKELEERKAEEAEGNGKKRKRPSKKDLERFKEQKKQKKIAKTAWLRT